MVRMLPAVLLTRGVLFCFSVVFVVVVPVTRGGSLERSASHFLKSQRVAFRVLRLPWHPIDGERWADFPGFWGVLFLPGDGEKKMDRGGGFLRGSVELGAAFVAEVTPRKARGAAWGAAFGTLPGEGAEPGAVHAPDGDGVGALARRARNHGARGVVRGGGENLMGGVDPHEVRAGEAVRVELDALNGARSALHGVGPKRPAGGLEVEAVRLDVLPLLRGFGGFVGEASGGHFRFGGSAFSKGDRRKKKRRAGRSNADPVQKKTS